MRLPAFKLRTLMIVVAVLAVALFGSTRCDISSLPQQVIWRGPEFPNRNIIPGPVMVLEDPQLAFWVIPCITILVVQGSRRSKLARAATCLILVALASWVVLRRGAAMNAVWPTTHVAMFRQWLSAPATTGLWIPGIPLLDTMSAFQYTDLVCLLVLLATMLLWRIRPLSRKFLAIVTLAVNSVKFMEWANLMWFGSLTTDWARIGRGNLSLARALTPFDTIVPPASLIEIAEGPIMIGVICYVVFVLLVHRSPPQNQPAPRPKIH